MSIIQPKLDFTLDALEPYISQATMDNHYNHHHKTYIDKLNGFIEAGDTQGEHDLESIVKSSQGGVYNNAAQTWNHNFFWQCLTPAARSQYSPALETMIGQSFGSMDQFKQALTQAAATRFGSGWVWLVKNQDDQLEIITTPNAENPLTNHSVKTIALAIDVWEHAYYLDTQYNRAAYIDNCWKVINWNFVQAQLEA